jgi:hypothetical protein
VFTLAPALANTAVFLDLTSTTGAKHLKGTSEPLNQQPFDFADSSSDLQSLLGPRPKEISGVGMEYYLYHPS